MSEEKELIQREFPAALETTGDGRTLDLRVIPYNEKARVTDNGRDFYDEVWEPGCFDRQLDAPNRVLLNFEHERGIGGVVGRGTELRNSTDALEGTFRMLAGHDADKALELVNEGALAGVSLEAEPIKTVREDGITRRVKARLVNVALCRTPAFKGAQVMAVRETPEPDEPIEEPGVPEPPPPEPAARSDVDELLERVGWEPLISRAVTKKPWDGSPARFEDDEYKRSCLIDRGGDAPVKERCSLSVLEPNGDINANALGAAAGRLNQTKAPGDLKAKAARKLVRYYNTAKMPAPASLRAMASR